MARGTMISLEIKYDTPLHKKLFDALDSRIKASRTKMQSRHEDWRKAEELYLAYTPASEEDQRRKERRDSGSQEFITVTIPYSYATLLTAHTYWASVFLSRNPVHQYTGRHGETQQQVQMVDALIDYQVQVGKHLVPYYIWLLDAGKYGVGIVGNYWAEDKTVVSEIHEVQREFMGIPIPGTSTKKKEVRTIRGYVGNRVYNIRPYDLLPDPKVSLVNLQQGEFCGRQTHISWNDVLRRADAKEYFNISQLKKRTLELGERQQGSAQIETPDWEEHFASYISKAEQKRPQSVHIAELVWDLVPKEWDLGDGTYPEKWVFTIGQGNVIIGARPLGEDHNQFPYFLQTYEIDGYSHASRGMMEILEPLNKTLDWLFNSHFYNVRKALNDNLVVDPSRVVMKDLRDGGPGRLIRLRPEAYGMDVRTIAHQLQMMDVTVNNIRDALSVIEVIQRVSGVSDNLMGMLDPGGRKTATEVRTSSSFGINRLKTIAEWNSALGWAPLASVLLQNTQQRYDMERMFKVAGDLLEGAPKFVQVTPEDIQGFFDFVPVDGTFPIDRFAQANLWKEILMGLAKMPQIAMQYDLGGIFSWMAQLAGLKNITQFKIQVTPDQQAMLAAERGNLVPINAGEARQTAPQATGIGATRPD